MPVVLVTGATGFLGKAVVARFLAAGWRIVALSRDPLKARGHLPTSVEILPWPAAQLPRAFDAVVHLAGASIAGGLWTRRRKDVLWRSRVDGTRSLVTALSSLEKPPPVFVSASGTGYYGHRSDATVHPGDPPGTDFLGRMAAAWEDAARGAEEFGARTVYVRLGMVLGRDGGALRAMCLPFSLGLGAVLGDGKQYWPWIHRDDAAELFFRAATDAALRGPLHGAVGEPVTQREFAGALAASLHRPLFFRVPAPVLRGVVGEMADLFLHGQRIPQDAGFTPRHATLAAALRAP